MFGNFCKLDQRCYIAVFYINIELIEIFSPMNTSKVSLLKTVSTSERLFLSVSES